MNHRYFERFKTAVVQPAVNSAFIAPESLEEPGHTVCVRASHGRSARGLAHSMTLFSLWDSTFKHWRDIFSLAYYCGPDAVTGMKNLESKSKKEDVTRNAFKRLEGLHLPNLLQKVCAHMNLKQSTLRSTQNYIDAWNTEQWVTFHLDHPDNKDFVNQTAGMRRFRMLSARGLARSTSFLTSAQLPMRRSEQKSQLWARGN